MTILHILRDKLLGIFGIDDLLDDLVDDRSANRNARIVDLKKRDEDREKFAARMRGLIEQQKRLAREESKK